MTITINDDLENTLDNIADEVYDHFLDRFDHAIDLVANTLIEGQGLDLDAMPEEEAEEEWMRAFNAAAGLIINRVARQFGSDE